jgi:3-oxoacyl-[acyl-carrier protein] reductase
VNLGFAGWNVVVTGAGHGIGRGIAHEFTKLGARTLALDINVEGLAETAKGVRANSAGSIKTAYLDVTDAAGIKMAIEAFGQVDSLIHSAGGVKGQVGRPIEAISFEDWQAILSVNLTGAFLMAQATVPGMKAVGRGSIVMISSGAGLGVSLTGIQAYAAAKAGEIGLTRQLAHELGPFGIRVNSVAPGFVRSNPTTERQWEAYGPEGQRQLVNAIALGRTGTVADIVPAVLFLASDLAGWITGQTLSVDGGK